MAYLRRASISPDGLVVTTFPINPSRINDTSSISIDFTTHHVCIALPDHWIFSLLVPLSAQTKSLPRHGRRFGDGRHSLLFALYVISISIYTDSWPRGLYSNGILSKVVGERMGQIDTVCPAFEVVASGYSIYSLISKSILINQPDLHLFA